MGFIRSKRRCIAFCAATLTFSLLTGCTNKCSSVRTSETTQAETSRTEASPVPVVNQISSQEALADFDAAWNLINETHFDTTFNGVDWAAMREEYRPMSQAATTRAQNRGVISRMLNTLGQSHFGIIPEAEETTPSDHSGDAFKVDTDDADDITASEHSTDALLDGMGNADLGMEILIIDQRAVVSAIREDGPADLAGVHTGWVLSEFRNRPVSNEIEQLIDAIGEELIGIYGVAQLSNNLRGPEGSTVNLTFLDADENEHNYTISRVERPGEAVTFGNLPPMQTNLDWGWFDDDKYNLGGKKIGYIKFSVWMMPIALKFEQAMIGLKDADGIVIDLRNNPGGIAGLGAGIARYFIDEKQSLGTMQMRGQEMEFNVSPIIVSRSGERLKPFTNPVAILTNQGSASTSEFFAGGLQAFGRVEVFGTRSAGMALAAAMDKLPSGDVLLHAISDYTTSAGNTIEATGVIPEHPVPVTREDLLKGIDAPMQAAAEWIKYKD